jgi:glycosyltransferase involved in cell wall biosynthesis
LNFFDKWPEVRFDLNMDMNEKRIWGTLDPFYESGAVLGRKVANARFMDFLLRADPFDEYHFFLGSEAAARAQRETLQRMAPSIAARGGFSVMDRRELPSRLAATRYHCFHQSDCMTLQPHLARLRNARSRRIFPITGVTHSLSYADYGRLFLQHVWPGATPRDCIVSTSTAGVAAVENHFEALRQGYGLESVPGPVVRRIPLGIDPQTFEPAGRSGQGPCSLLVFGRISHYSKMDLLPLLRALHRLFSDGLDPASVRLVLAGWTEDNDDYTPVLRELAANIGLDLVIRARPTEAEKTAIFHEADVFVSIADNPQETFGITVLEAGAFGLPAVVSDYDGYKDLVRHEVTGLLVPTVGPQCTDEADLMAPFTYDNHYHLLLAQQTAVQIPALAESLHRLIADPDLRRTMGQAARERVCRQFAWPQVIEQYVRLWDELNDEPVDEASLRGVAHPAQVQFARVFGHYPTQSLHKDMLLAAGRTGQGLYRGRDFPLLYAGLERVIDPEVLKHMVFLARKPVTVAEMLERLGGLDNPLDPGRAEYHVLWALKHDILELTVFAGS